MNDSNSKRNSAILAATILLLLGAGVADGIITNRWAPSDELQRASAAIQNLPLEIGEWTGVDREIDERELKIAAATAFIQRTYTNQTTGDQIIVTCLCGPHGPISLHPPTVCFTGAGWRLTEQEKPENYDLDDQTTCRFWQARFTRRNQLQEEEIVTDWSWNNGEGWKASTNPRFEYAGSPFLYKLYFTSPARLANEQSKSLRDDFVKMFLSEFDRTVLESQQKTTPNQ